MLLGDWSVVPLAAVLAVASPLPWFAAQLMPDLFVALLVLALVLLLFVPERLARAERVWLAGLAAFAMTAHLSSLPLALALLLLLAPLRRRLGAAAPLGRAGVARLVSAPLLALLAMTGVNLAGHGTASHRPLRQRLLARPRAVRRSGHARARALLPASGVAALRFRGRVPANCR